VKIRDENLKKMRDENFKKIRDENFVKIARKYRENLSRKFHENFVKISRKLHIFTFSYRAVGPKPCLHVQKEF